MEPDASESCAVCQRVYPSREALSLHVQTHVQMHAVEEAPEEEGSEPLTCTVCEAKYHSPEALVKHVWTHVAEQGEQGDEEDAKGQDDVEGEDSGVDDGDPDDGDHPDEAAEAAEAEGRSADTSREATGSEAEHNGLAKARWACRQCGQPCKNYNKWWVHEKSHELVRCDVCNMVFQGRRKFYRHMKVKHGMRTRLSPNNIVSKSQTPGPKPSSASKSMTPGCRPQTSASKSKTPGRKPQTSASKSKTPGRKPQTSASKSKTPVRKPQTSASKNPAQSVPKAQEPVARSHAKDGSYKCSKCSAQFGSQAWLTRHTKSEHDSRVQRKPPRKPPPPSSKDRPYPCSFCSWSFKCVNHLKDHLMMHIGIKPFDCPTCDKKFRTKHSRKTHSLVCQRK